MHEDHPINEQRPMTAKEAAILLSDTLINLKRRKITMRHAHVLSQLAVSLIKIIETADLENRIVILEQQLAKRQKGT